MRLLVLIPAHNESASLPGVVRELRATLPETDILVVDDASRDGTPELLRTLSVRWMRLVQHLGLGGAVRAGLRYAFEGGYDAVVRLDADGQHAAASVRELAAQLRDADAVVGSRYLARAGYSAPLVRRATQRVLAAALTVLTRQPVTDPTSGLWAFGRRAIALLAEHHPTGYPEPELRLLLYRNGLEVAEVPAPMRNRATGRTSLTPLRAIASLARAFLAMIVVPLRARHEL